MSNPKPPVDETEARKLLERERDRIESSLADLKRVVENDRSESDQEIDLIGRGEHIEDGQVDEAVIRQLKGELEAVERAEQRVEEGTYGISVESGEPIPAKRLEAVPWAERTAEEQSRLDKRP